jgi:PAS domain S-box-containing protein
MPFQGNRDAIRSGAMNGAADQAPPRGSGDICDFLPHLVWAERCDGGWSHFNQQWVDYSGLSMAESMAGGWPVLVHPDDVARASVLRAAAHAGDVPARCECRLRRADGVYRWMMGATVAQRGQDGRLEGWAGSFTDIEDFKAATDGLERQLYMNRLAGRVAQLGGWTIDLPDRKLTWSDECCVIHDVPPGYQPTLDEGISLFPPEHRAAVISRVQACMEHGTPYEFLLPKYTVKGRLIWVRSLGEAVRGADGKIIRIQGAFQDITAQKLAEERMRVLESQLVSTVESMGDGFYLVGPDWTFRYMNVEAERLLRRPRDELLGKNLWTEFAGARGTIVEKEFRAAVAEKRSTHFEIYFEPLGTWFSAHAHPTEAGLAVYFQDVGQRRGEQSQLRLLETAVAHLNDMVVIMEAVGENDKGPRIVFVNDAFERTTGYTRQEAVGNQPSIVWGPKTPGPELDRIRNAMKRWQPVRGEVVVYTKAGRELCVETEVVPILDDTGRVTHWVGVERDVTERRQQQQLILGLNTDLEQRVLRRTEQLAAANREMEAFAYSVSHDLRSPLNTVHGFSQLLMKADAEKLSEKGRHYLDRVGVGVKQMGELIEGLLTLAQLSREKVRFEQVDLSALARRIVDELREREPERQVAITVGDKLQGTGDPRLLAAVLQNLLGNAWKFTSRRSEAQIELGCDHSTSGEARYFVRDNGAGFDMAFAEKLFGTFERLHSPGDFPGTGIGLATVKRVIERHGGRVWAEGRPEEGAAFYFTLGDPPNPSPSSTPRQSGRAGQA